jgi:hypothetical protein
LQSSVYQQGNGWLNPQETAVIHSGVLVATQVPDEA